METNKRLIDIQNLSLLKITKVKPWAVYFDYNQKHYLLHGTTDGYEQGQNLYERDLNENGFYTLIPIAGNYGEEDVGLSYIKSLSNTVVYNQIDKEYFRERLIRNKLIHNSKLQKEILFGLDEDKFE